MYVYILQFSVLNQKLPEVIYLLLILIKGIDNFYTNYCFGKSKKLLSFVYGLIITIIS